MRAAEQSDIRRMSGMAMKLNGYRYRTIAVVAASVVAVALVVPWLGTTPARASVVALAGAGPLGLATAATLTAMEYAIEAAGGKERRR